MSRVGLVLLSLLWSNNLQLNLLSKQKQQNERKEKRDWLKICLSLWGQILLSRSLPLQTYNLKAGISQDRILDRLKNPRWIAQQKAFKRDKPGWKYPYKKWGLGRKLSKADASQQKLSDRGGRGLGNSPLSCSYPEVLQCYLERPASRGGLIRALFWGYTMGDA